MADPVATAGGGDGADLIFSDGADIDVHFTEILKLQVTGGEAEAMCNLAKRYENGRGVPVNIDAAAYWYSRAALAGDVDDAIYKVACMYRDGHGMPKDTKAAGDLMAWFVDGSRTSKVDNTNTDGDDDPGSNPGQPQPSQRQPQQSQTRSGRPYGGSRHLQSKPRYRYA